MGEKTEKNCPFGQAFLMHPHEGAGVYWLELLKGEGPEKRGEIEVRVAQRSTHKHAGRDGGGVTIIEQKQHKPLHLMELPPPR